MAVLSLLALVNLPTGLLSFFACFRNWICFHTQILVFLNGGSVAGPVEVLECRAEDVDDSLKELWLSLARQMFEVEHYTSLSTPMLTGGLDSCAKV
jgi:anthranilate/para-aminobenzoate synthase component II